VRFFLGFFINYETNYKCKTDIGIRNRQDGNGSKDLDMTRIIMLGDIFFCQKWGRLNTRQRYSTLGYPKCALVIRISERELSVQSSGSASNKTNEQQIPTNVIDVQEELVYPKS
jgi:hypothetical protein